MSRFIRLLPTLLIGSGLVLLLPAQALASDTTPPVTNLNLNGTLGNNGWYVSTVDAKFRASDLQSGPASITYQVDSDTPVTTVFDSTENAILNASFEDGTFFNITNWDKVGQGFAFMWQSYTPSKFGFGSAAILTLSNQYQYWTNINYPVPVVAGQPYTVSTWVKTVNITSSPGAWFEMWAKDSTGTNSDIKLGISDQIIGDFDWQVLSLSRTIPTGYDQVYLKLGDQAAAGIAYYDGVAMFTGTDAISQATIVNNGTHSLQYHSTDNIGNVESTQTFTPIKIDTVDPQDWNSFNYVNSGNNHTFTSSVTVKDVTSGLDVSTAQVRNYDVSNCDCWSSWVNVASVKKTSDNSNAADGYANTVKLTTASTDFGNSATTPKVQFRVFDVAGNEGDSPVYAIFGPWLKLTGGGDIFSNGPISISGSTPAGQFSSDGLAASGGSISNLTTKNSWYLTPYAVPFAPASGISTYIPQYSRLVGQASSLPSNKLPSTSGIYLYTGNYTIDATTLSASFQAGTFSAVVIVNGNLTINQNFQLASAAAVAFLVTGNVTFNGSVTTTAGMILAGGTINTGSSGNQLTHQGSLLALSGLTLSRDLGKNGNPNNSTTPGETIAFPAQYISNATLAQLLSGGSSSQFTWQESH